MTNINKKAIWISTASYHHSSYDMAIGVVPLIFLLRRRGEGGSTSDLAAREDEYPSCTTTPIMRYLCADTVFFSRGGGSSEILPTSCVKVVLARKIWATKFGVRGRGPAPCIRICLICLPGFKRETDFTSACIVYRTLCRNAFWDTFDPPCGQTLWKHTLRRISLVRGNNQTLLQGLRDFNKWKESHFYSYL